MTSTCEAVPLEAWSLLFRNSSSAAFGSRAVQTSFHLFQTGDCLRDDSFISDRPFICRCLSLSWRSCSVNLLFRPSTRHFIRPLFLQKVAHDIFLSLLSKILPMVCIRRVHILGGRQDLFCSLSCEILLKNSMFGTTDSPRNLRPLAASLLGKSRSAQQVTFASLGHDRSTSPRRRFETAYHGFAVDENTCCSCFIVFFLIKTDYSYLFELF